MKGVIALCLRALVVDQFGQDKWEQALVDAGLDKNTSFRVTQDVDDEAVLAVVSAVCGVLNITLQQAADAFGEYWVCTYAPQIYKAYYQGKDTAKDFLLKMDEVHQLTTANIPNAHPPRFEYSWENERTLIMKYRSHRNLLDFLVGLARGVGKFYKEQLQVEKLGNDGIKITFA